MHRNNYMPRPSLHVAAFTKGVSLHAEGEVYTSGITMTLRACMGRLTSGTTRTEPLFCRLCLCPILFRQNTAIHQSTPGATLGSGWDADEEHDFGDFLRGAHI